MAEQLLVQAQDIFEGQIDFEGQRLAENLTTSLLAAAGVLSFLIGFVTRDIYLSLWSGLAGAALVSFIVVPPWPFFNKNPVKWITPESNVGIIVDGKKIS